MSRASFPPLEDDFARALLGSADADQPSHAAYAKAAATLGVGVGLGVGAALPVVALGTAGVAQVARWSSSLGAKLLLLGASGALLGVGVLLFTSSEPARPAIEGQAASVPALQAAHKSSEPAPALPVARASEREATLPEPGALPSPGALPASGAPPAKPVLLAPSPTPRPAAAVAPAGRRAVHVAPARATGDSSLAEQVQSLDRARVALAAGDSSSALREIAHYRAAWPDGVFLTEASVLEIEALAARGERAKAATRAADFVAAHPDSPQAERLRALSHRAKH